MIRVVQPGRGAVRPLVLVFTPKDVDQELRDALGPDPMVAVDQRPKWDDFETVDSLAETIRNLEGTTGGKLAPIVVAGFSAGGNGTRHLLALGGDPDALVTADATYGSTPEGMKDWGAYAERAKRGERTFIASHTSYLYPSSTWGVLRAISGLDLPLGAGAPNAPSDAPTIHGTVERRNVGRLVIYSYPTWDGAGHERQATTYMPRMIQEALELTRGYSRGGGGSAGGFIAAVLGLGTAWLLKRRRKG
jgi:hypothetical protein